MKKRGRSAVVDRIDRDRRAVSGVGSNPRFAALRISHAECLTILAVQELLTGLHPGIASVVERNIGKQWGQLSAWVALMTYVSWYGVN